MAEARIPVDLTNPGQVFACLGFLEAVDVLIGGAEGGFDWSDEADVRFVLRADSEEIPVKAVLRFLAEAEVIVLAPARVDGPWPDGAQVQQTFPAPPKALETSDGKAFTASALPIKLQAEDNTLTVSNWLEANDSREPFKLFAGQQVAATLARNMLEGDEKKKGTKGLRDLKTDFEEDDFKNPFGITCAVGGRFGFDSRGAWDARRIGTSLDEQGVFVDVSPHVELLSAIGLEHTRPEFLSTYQIRYGVWDMVLPLTLCRVMLANPAELLPKPHYRMFRTHLGDDQQYKKVFSANMED